VAKAETFWCAEELIADLRSGEEEKNEKGRSRTRLLCRKARKHEARRGGQTVTSRKRGRGSDQRSSTRRVQEAANVARNDSSYNLEERKAIRSAKEKEQREKGVVTTLS